MEINIINTEFCYPHVPHENHDTTGLTDSLDQITIFTIAMHLLATMNGRVPLTVNAPMDDLNTPY